MWSSIANKDSQQLDQYFNSIKKNKTLVNLLLSRNEHGRTPLLEAISGSTEDCSSGSGGSHGSSSIGTNSSQGGGGGSGDYNHHSKSKSEKIVSIILNYSGGIGINAQDFESGYSALHKCLLKGQLKMALLLLKYTNVDYTLMDKEGMTALEMFDASIKLPKIHSVAPTLLVPSDNGNNESHLLEDFGSHAGNESMVTISTADIEDDEDENRQNALYSFQEASSSMSYWSWGSNNNYLLGHGMSDSRIFPEQVSLEPKKKRSASIPFSSILEHDPQIIMIVMSKYHVALLTKTCFYTYGFGTGGRLGHGNEETSMTPKILTGIEGKITFVALGPDHSMAITDDGKVWTWGSNKHAQLGYTLTSGEKSLIPQEVGMKKAFIIGGAAGKFHSVVFANTGAIYSWGTNNGQLGYSDRNVQNFPRRITSLANQKILQAATTINSTVLLCENHQVTVLVNNETRRLQFPVNPPPKITRFLNTKPPHPIKIKSGDNDIGIVLSNGDICVWSSGNGEEGGAFHQPRKLWRARKKNRIALDCSIGVDSCLIVATESGHVFIGTLRAGQSEKLIGAEVVNMKFQKIANLEHVVNVVASSSGSFAAVRSDFRCPQSLDSVPTLSVDLKTATGVNISRSDFDFTFVALEGKKVLAHKIILHSRSRWFENLLTKGTVHISTPGVHFDAHSNTLHLDDYSHFALALILEFLYSGSYKQPWENSIFFGASKGQDPKLARIHADFKRLVKLFMLDETEILQSSISKKYLQIGSIFLNYQTLYNNVSIQLKDGVCNASSLFLSSRCPFFGEILGKPSPFWKLQTDNEGLPIVNLPHISSGIFNIILYWIMSDSSLIFENSPPLSSLEEWIEEIKTLLVVGDELLLPKIVSICCSLLSRLITINNTLDLLKHALTYGAVQLKEACLDFLVRNLETFLKSSKLQDIDDSIIIAIELKLKELRIAKLPLMLGPAGFYEKLREVEKLQIMDRKAERRKMPRVSSLESNNSGFMMSSSLATSVAPSPLLSPAFRGSSSRDTLAMSPLLMPLRASYSMSPLLTPSKTHEAASSSMEDLTLESSWTEARTKRRPSFHSAKKPPIARSISPHRAFDGSSPKSLELSSFLDRHHNSSPFLSNSHTSSLEQSPFAAKCANSSFLGKSIQMLKNMRSPDNGRPSEGVSNGNSSSSPFQTLPNTSPSTRRPISTPTVLIHEDDQCHSPTKQSTWSQLSAKLTPSKIQPQPSPIVQMENTLPTRMPAKLSQRERKRLSSSSNAHHGMDSNSSPMKQSPPKIDNSPASSSPWSITIPSPKFELGYIMRKEEEKRKELSSSATAAMASFSGSLKSPVKWKVPSLDSSPSTTQKSTSSALSFATSTSTTIPPKVSLRSIQDQQQHQSKLQEQERLNKNKKISQIQEEESALQELRTFYKETAGENTGEWATIVLERKGKNHYNN